MPFFENATNVNASNSVFNDIKGDQINHYHRAYTMDMNSSSTTSRTSTSFYKRAGTMGANAGNMPAGNFNPSNNPFIGFNAGYFGRHVEGRAAPVPASNQDPYPNPIPSFAMNPQKLASEPMPAVTSSTSTADKHLQPMEDVTESMEPE